jgi:NAD(P)-dependent dehydrogenase (short-subunit alcohol dehydrogenase family)
MTLDIFDLTGKVALTVGGSKGIGYAVALGLARAGADVAVAARTATDTERVAAEIEGLGKRSLPVQVDVTDVSQINAMVDRVVSQFGRIDILYNGVGFGMGGPSFDFTPEQWDRMMAVNLRGAFFCAQAVGKVMAAQGGGKIINVGSELSVVALPERTCYCASKGGVVQMTKALAVEWARYNINVNAVGPTAVKTAGNTLLHNPEMAAKVVARIPQNRLAEPEEMVGAVVYLASAASSRVTGHFLLADGGLTAL